MLTKECKDMIHNQFKKYEHLNDKKYVSSLDSQILALLALNLYFLDRNEYIGREITTKFIFSKYEIGLSLKNIDEMSSYFIIEKTSNKVCVFELKKESHFMSTKIEYVDGNITSHLSNREELHMICSEIGIPVKKYELNKIMRLGQRILVEQLKEDMLCKIFIESKLPQEKVIYPDKLIERNLIDIAQRAVANGLYIDSYISSKMVIDSLNKIVFDYMRIQKKDDYKELLNTYKFANNIPNELLVSNKDFENSYLQLRVQNIISQRNIFLDYISRKWDTGEEYQNLKRKNDLLLRLYNFLRYEDFKFSSEIMFEHDGKNVTIEENPFTTFNFEKPKIKYLPSNINNIKGLSVHISFVCSMIEGEYFDQIVLLSISSEKLKPLQIVKDGLTVFEITKTDIDNI